MILNKKEERVLKAENVIKKIYEKPQLEEYLKEQFLHKELVELKKERFFDIFM